jgi:hypothetical protein
MTMNETSSYKCAIFTVLSFIAARNSGVICPFANAAFNSGSIFFRVG